MAIKRNRTTQLNCYWLTCGDMTLRKTLQAAARRSRDHLRLKKMNSSPQGHLLYMCFWGLTTVNDITKHSTFFKKHLQKVKTNKKKLQFPQDKHTHKK